jgi:uncharacterized repeat protein (TIGR01451 family)
VQLKHPFIWLALLLALFWNREAAAQSYLLRYVNTANGAVTFTGNTLGLAKATGANQPGTLDSIGTFITLNTNSQVNTYPKGTTTNWLDDSSAAVLRIPTNSTILYAELIWAGSAQIAADAPGPGNVLSNLNTPVKFILPNGSSNNVSPDPLTASLVTNGTSAIFYVRSANVTALVQAAGAGTYSAGGMPGTVIAAEDSNNALGWTLAVVYGNNSLNYRNLSLFIGNSFAISGGTAPNPAVVSGFSTPFTGTVSGRLSVSALEGDSSKVGDQMKFGPTTNTLKVLSGPNNVTNNFFASQINDDNGLLDTSGTFGLSNSVPPTVGFSARQGWDITSVDVSSELSNGLTNAYAQNITVGDGYSVNALALEIDAQQEADVALFKSGPANVQAGSNITYTITITNLGPASASNVVASDTLPTNVFFASASGDGTNTTGIVSWSLGTLPANATSNVTVTVTAPAGGTITNRATVASTTTDPNPANNTSPPVTTAVTPVADVVVTNAGPANVLAGTVYTNTISVTNLGPSVASNIVVVDTEPGGVLVTNTFVSLASGVGTNFTVIETAPGSGPLTNSATSTASTGDPDLGNNTNIVAVTVVTPEADLAVGKIGPASVFAGTSFGYTISVTNFGPSTVTVLSVTDSLPVGLVFVSSSSGATTNAGNQVIWTNLNSLAAGGVVNLTLNVTATSRGTVTNLATVGSSTVDPIPANNTSVPVVTAVTNRPPVVVNDNGSTSRNTPVSISVLSNDSDPDGDTLMIVGVSATNGTPSISETNVVYTPPNILGTNTIIYTVSDGNGGTNSGLITVAVTNRPPVAVNDTATSALNVPVSVPVLVNDNDPDGDTLTIVGVSPTNGTASISGANVVFTPTNNLTGTVRYTISDGFGGTNSALVIISVTNLTASADIQVFVSGPTNVTVGDGFSYTIVVTNSGPSAATNTLAQDVLPTNLVFVSASGGGVASNNVVTWPVFPVLTNGEATNLILTVAPLAGASTNSTTQNPFNFIETNTTASVGFLTNSASAFAATFDPNLTNNSASTAYTNAQVQTVIVPGVFSVFIATNTYATNSPIYNLTNTITPIGPNLFIVGTSAFNPQTGLYEEDVTVTNIGTVPVHALRLYVGGLRNGVTMYNATGTTNGVPYVEYDPPFSTPLLPGDSVTFLLEFFVSDRHPFTNSLTAVAILAPSASTVTGTPAPISQLLILNNTSNPRFLIQFDSIPGRTYTILYSDNLITWNVAVPSIVASADITQWYDNGPPNTLSNPMSVSRRFYELILDP